MTPIDADRLNELLREHLTDRESRYKFDALCDYVEGVKVAKLQRSAI